MSDFIFDTINPFENQNFSEGNFLWIWHADKIPPHIGISVDGKYFSLKFNGKDDGISTEISLKIIGQKQIPSLIIELKKEIFLDKVRVVFDGFDRTKSNETSCLNPVVKLIDVQNVKKLSDLLFELRKSNQMGNVFGVFLPKKYDRIPNYSMEQIHERLKKLQDE